MFFQVSNRPVWPGEVNLKFKQMKSLIIIIFTGLFFSSGCAQETSNKTSSLNYKKLTPEEQRVILHKGTEAPFTGKYDDFFEPGTYVCKLCGAPLFRSTSKFNSGCGWPSFDDEIPGAVLRIPDPDGMRTEIVCATCGAHLGHVFTGEQLTPKNTRYCVNSVSMEFIPAGSERDKPDTAIVAGGCFWGVQYFMEKIPGVLSTEAGYIGGHGKNPTYWDVSSHTTGYAEAVRVIFDPDKTSYEAIAKLFFDIHDPTQVNRQGPDIGDQYRSEIFYLNEAQKDTAQKLIRILEQKGYNVATKLEPAGTFWKAEAYHQEYYKKNGKTPYCHAYVNRFGKKY